MTLHSWKEMYLPLPGRLAAANGHRGSGRGRLDAPSTLLRSFRIIVLELHSLERMFRSFAYRIMRACCEKLLQDFYVVHAHPNNCAGFTVYHSIEIPHVLELRSTAVGAARRAHSATRSACTRCRQLQEPASACSSALLVHLKRVQAQTRQELLAADIRPASQFELEQSGHIHRIL